MLELQQECGFVNTPNKKQDKQESKRSPSSKILDVQKQLSSQKGFLKTSPKRDDPKATPRSDTSQRSTAAQPKRGKSQFQKHGKKALKTWIRTGTSPNLSPNRSATNSQVKIEKIFTNS